MTTLFSQTIRIYNLELFSNYHSTSQSQDSIMQYTGGRDLSLAEKKRNCSDMFCHTLQNKCKSNCQDLEFKEFVQHTVQTTLTRLSALCASYQKNAGSLEPLLEHFNQLVIHTYDVFHQHQLLNLNQNFCDEDAAIILKKNLADYLIKNKILNNGFGAHKAEYGHIKGLIRYSGRNIKLANKKEILVENFLSKINDRLHNCSRKSGHYNTNVLNIIEEIRRQNNIICEEHSLKGHLPLPLGSFIFTVHIPTEFKQGQGTLENYLNDAENKIASLRIIQSSQPSSRSKIQEPQSPHQSPEILKTSRQSPTLTTKRHSLPQSPTVMPTSLASAAPLVRSSPPHTSSVSPGTTRQLARHQEHMPAFNFPAPNFSTPDEPENKDFAQLSALYGLTSPK